MTATLAIMRVTARNVLGVKRLLGFGLLAMFPAGVFILLARTASDINRSEGFTTMTMGTFLPVIMPIITIVISASVLGSERRGNTLSFLMLRPLSRFNIAGAKLISAIAASFVITGAGAAVLGIAGSLVLNDFGYLTALLVATLIGTAGYSAIYMPLGYLTERSTLIGFIYIFIWELALAGAIQGLSGTSIYRISASAFAGLAPEGLDVGLIDASLGTLSAGAGGAVIKVLVLGAVSVAFTGWLLRTRDLT